MALEWGSYRDGVKFSDRSELMDGRELCWRFWGRSLLAAEYYVVVFR